MDEDGVDGGARQTSTVRGTACNRYVFKPSQSAEEEWRFVIYMAAYAGGA